MWALMKSSWHITHMNSSFMEDDNSVCVAVEGGGADVRLLVPGIDTDTGSCVITSIGDAALCDTTVGLMMAIGQSCSCVLEQACDATLGGVLPAS